MRKRSRSSKAGSACEGIIFVSFLRMGTFPHDERNHCLFSPTSGKAVKGLLGLSVVV